MTNEAYIHSKLILPKPFSKKLCPSIYSCGAYPQNYWNVKGSSENNFNIDSYSNFINAVFLTVYKHDEGPRSRDLVNYL